jgi:hypothetical protein
MRAERAGRGRRGFAVCLGVLGLCLDQRAARASAFELLGFGPSGVAEVNARGARADDGTATFYNPGGLAMGRGVRLELAPTIGASLLQVQGKTQPLADPFGIAFAFDATVPLRGALQDRIRLGLGGYLLPTSLAHVIARESDAPFYPYFDNRSQRLVLVPALAVRIARPLGIGAGINVLGDVGGDADVGKGSSGSTESRVAVRAGTRVAAHVGVRVDPSEHVRFGFTFRQGFSIPSRVDTTAEVGGVPLSVEVGAESLFDPHVFVLASSFDVGRFTFEIDASYAVWSAYDGPFVTVRARLPGVDVTSTEKPDFGRDVASVRGAVAVKLDVGKNELVLRGGLGFEPTMLKSVRQGETNLVDGDKVLLGAGATFTIASVLGRTLRFGAGLGTAIVLPFSQDKQACRSLPCRPGEVAGPDAADPSAGIDNPGFPRLEAGGALLSASLGVGVDL